MNYVIAFLYSGDKVLLLRRCNASFGNCQYSLVGGKIEPGEAALQALVREIKEEIGLTLQEKDLTFVHALYRKGTESDFVALCFSADITGKEIINAEPEKHDDMQFFSVHNLPENILPAHKQVIEAILIKRYYSEHGW